MDNFSCDSCISKIRLFIRQPFPGYLVPKGVFEMKYLLELVEKEKIMLSYLPLREYRQSLWGLYIPGKHGINPAIYLDRELKHNPKLYRLARCILAEELGHYFTGIGSSVFKIHANYSLERKMSVEEERALHWATSRLISTDEVLELLRRNKCECTDLADYFEVTTWFMFRKLEFVQYQIKARRREISFDLITQVKFSCL